MCGAVSETTTNLNLTTVSLFSFHSVSVARLINKRKPKNIQQQKWQQSTYLFVRLTSSSNSILWKFLKTDYYEYYSIMFILVYFSSFSAPAVSATAAVLSSKHFVFVMVYSVFFIRVFFCDQIGPTKNSRTLEGIFPLSHLLKFNNEITFVGYALYERLLPSPRRLASGWVSEWVSRVQRPTRHNIGHFGGGLHSQSLDWYWQTKQYRKINMQKLNTNQTT